VLGDGSPAWLSLDSASRTLSGTPNDAVVPSDKTLVGVQVALIAADKTGRTAANTTLVVSRSLAPIVRVPLEEQIEKFGPYSAPSSVLFHPSSDFSFEFDANTFIVDSTESTGKTSVDDSQTSNTKRDDNGGMSDVAPQLNYYAVSGDNAPLPSWVVFDAGKLIFSGTTPPLESLIQPPQTFDFKLVGSDVVGFSSTSIDFSIVVGTHELTAEEPFVELNATIGTKLEYTGLQDLLKIDKQPLGRDNITSIRADGLPTWLSFNEATWELSGTPDSEAVPTNVTISIVDKFLDSLNLTLAIEFETKLFISDLPSLNLSAGNDFSFDLKRFLFAPGNTQLTIQTDTGDSWIQFDDFTKILSGTVPEPLAAGFSNEVRVSFVATQRFTKARETENLSIHVDVPSQPTGTQGSRPNTKDENSRRDLYWLLVIPILVVAVVIILVIFAVRRRRERPKNLDFSDVSAPMSGAFMVNSSTDVSLYDMRKMLENGPPGPLTQSGTHVPAAPSNLRAAQTMSNQSIGSDQAVPHALTLHSGVVRPVRQGNAFVETGEPRLAGQKAQPSPAGTDEVSLLSDTSIGDEVYRDEDFFLDLCNPRTKTYGRKIGLDVPIIAEPFSIQPTPDPAYNRPTRKYTYISDDGAPPAVSYANRRRSGQQQSNGAGFGGIQNRLSKAWKRGSASRWLEDTKRNSHLSASTDVTTRTSILTSGITEEATTANTNLVARPTVIHIPGRPGEVRQVSRRTNDSVTFFGGRALTKTYRNFGRANGTVPKLVSPLAGDQVTRNSLGIAHKDVIQPNSQSGQLVVGKNEAGIGVAQTENGSAHRANQELVSSGRWPIPDTARGGVDANDRFRSKSEPPQRLPQPPPSKLPMTPTAKGKGGVSSSRGSSSKSASSLLSRTSSTNGQSIRRSSRDERLRASRNEEQKALDGSRAVMAKSPMPNNGRTAGVDRQLPETPSRTSRALLADRPNQSRAHKSTLSKRSVKTVRSNRSTQSGWTGDNDDDDAWEDIKPPASMVDGWEGEGSDRSFSVYI